VPDGREGGAFRERLRHLHAQAGTPTVDRLKEHADLRGHAVSRSALGTVLSGTNAMRWPTVAAFIDACASYAERRRQPLPSESTGMLEWRTDFDQAFPGTRLAARTRNDEPRSAAPAGSVDGEQGEFAPLLEFPVRVEPGSPALLLRADAETVPFRGRSDLLQELMTWIQGPERLSVVLVTGPGGQGKTRLARELTARLRGDGWVTGWLAQLSDEDLVGKHLLKLAGTSRPLLVIVDYAETRITQLVRLISRAAAAQPERLRLLLLARSAGAWWSQLTAASIVVERVLATASVVALPPLEETAADRVSAFRDAAGHFAAALIRTGIAGEADWAAIASTAGPPAQLAHERYGSALTLHMASLAALLQAGPRPVRQDKTMPPRTSSCVTRNGTGGAPRRHGACNSRTHRPSPAPWPQQPCALHPAKQRRRACSAAFPGCERNPRTPALESRNGCAISTRPGTGVTGEVFSPTGSVPTWWPVSSPVDLTCPAGCSRPRQPRRPSSHSKYSAGSKPSSPASAGSSASSSAPTPANSDVQPSWQPPPARIPSRLLTPSDRSPRN